jgi:hypothetical protein
MPTIGWVKGGIRIALHFIEHPPPHVHAFEAGAEASIVIATGEILQGRLSVSALRSVRDWVDTNRAELLDNWGRVMRHELPLQIV